jgi:hypothetical protein
MSVPLTEQKILQIRSGNHCAFPGCSELLVKPSTFGTRPVVTGEIAHIVSETPDGPRGKHDLPAGEHNKHTNLLFLCSPHHTEIDAQAGVYTVERLRQMKKEHEDAIEKAVAQAKEKEHPEALVLPLINEVVYSTLLPVTRMPKYIFSAPCTFGDAQQKEAGKEVLVSESPYLCPFIIRNGGVLFAFNDLRQADGPFRNIIDLRKVRISKTTTWLNNPDRAKWFVSLLNRTLNKLTGRKKLQLDREHFRYFFNADEPGKEKSVEYRPLNQSTTSRKVVWRPVRKSTNEPRNFWNHLAVNLRFVYVGKEQWCFSIRPEMRITKDGVESIDSEKVGSHVTRQKAHMFNYDLLEDVNFWRDYLSGGQPRITMRFGEKVGIIIPTTLMASKIQWPGIPEEFAKPFTNIDYEEDLFTSAEFQQFQTEDSEFVQEIETESEEIEDDLGE